MTAHFDVLQRATGLAVSEDVLSVARRIAEGLRADVVERERANEHPVREIETLREAGLLGLVLPREAGGAGESWRTASRVTRTIARADASIAHILGYHYCWTYIVDSFGTPQAADAIARTGAGSWLWASPGSSRAGLPKLKPVEGGGYLLEGESAFATGAPVADRLFAQTIHAENGRLVIVSFDPRAPQVEHFGDWDAVGQRLSASTAVGLRDVPIAESDVLAVLDVLGEPPTPSNSVSVLNFQLMFAVLLLGITEGALLEAREYTRTVTRPAFHSTVEHGYDEPFILNGYGKAVARVQAVAALVDRATDAFEWAYERGRDLTAEERAEVAEIIASAKIVATETALDVTAEIFELTGARAASRKHGLDRFWRDARTLSLHDPVAYKHNELGRYFVNGELPTPSGYR